ncbi:hypothetical protein PPERSA_05047 [Pseudocohnilembus persalinus]|uniref:Uncharacterized protein n=1 Tax=Pseudocohnilembus persalinus TaxID=266149 RepID=A0A0V0QW38_PSEPJ|nr:hypothetical protein PPERSA_05047 [Pseudocohnilembus persalinus]|eukprot:KRX06434.1 hypothetical protein PPERSA_05047 [Pseudocohnilembus persalinus]
MADRFYCTYVCFDKMKSTKFPGILNKLALQLSYYLNIQQPLILKQLNDQTENEKFVEHPKFNVWYFVWNVKNQQMSSFLQLHQYIGTQSLRLYFDLGQQQQEERVLDHDDLQSLKINNVPRISQPFGPSTQQEKPYQGKKAFVKSGDMKLARNQSNPQYSQQPLQQKQLSKEPETYEDYERLIDIIEEKMKKQKVINKELKETNVILVQSVQYLEQEKNKKSKQVQDIQKLVSQGLQIN